MLAGLLAPGSALPWPESPATPLPIVLWAQRPREQARGQHLAVTLPGPGGTDGDGVWAVPWCSLPQVLGGQLCCLGTAQEWHGAGGTGTSEQHAQAGRREGLPSGPSVYCWGEDCNQTWVAGGMQGEGWGLGTSGARADTVGSSWEQRVLWA